VAIDRDPAAGLRLGAFLLSCGLILGRGVAGDWHSAQETVVDFSLCVPYAALLLIVATLIERMARPTPQAPRAAIIAFGLLPSLVYLVFAIGVAVIMGRPA
jgi:hypothetical protein